MNRIEHQRTIMVIFILGAWMLGCQNTASERTPEVSTGKLIHLPNYESRYVDPRPISIWIPNALKDNSGQVPLLMMHDGLNLFDTGFSYTGDEWRVDEIMDSLIQLNLVESAIVVGIGNTPKRRREYQPNDLHKSIPDTSSQAIIREHRGKPLGDEYLSFITEELLPDIMSKFPIDTDHITMAGSSMGGAISIYALIRHPEVFSRVACISTHWPLRLEYNDSTIANAFVDFAGERVPMDCNGCLYFDHGTETLDAWYGLYQFRMDSILQGRNIRFESRVFKGAAHNENAWSKRLDKPLIFLLDKN